ncbi:MAG: TonB-dependent receptor [Gemmatimonadaceae bacterium]
MSCHLLRLAPALLSVMAASPLRALQQDSSDARYVIILDSLDRSTFANIAELLQARVPGLIITRGGGNALHWYMRGQGSFSGSAPLVLVDGVRVTVSEPSNPDLAGRPSQLDEIDIEDVERIEASSGPAIAANYGTGAGNGVIHIRTFTPRAQETTWRLYTSAGAIEDDVTYPASYSRPGATSSGTTSRCTLAREATDFCTPTGPVSAFNPFETESPFERALAARVGGAVGAMTGPIAWRGGATFDREGSTTGRLAGQRLHAHGAGSLSPTSTWEATVRVFWTRGDADMPSDLQSTLLSQGLFAAEPSEWTGFTQPPSSNYGSERYGATGNARWPLASWLDSRLTIGSGRHTDDDDMETSVEIQPGVFRRVTRRRARRYRDLTARAELTATYGARGVGGQSSLTVERIEGQDEEEFLHRVSDDRGTVSLRSTASNIETEITGVDLSQRVSLPARITVTGGVRLDRVELGEVTWESSPYPRAALTWDVRRSAPGLVGSLRLRAALGDAGNLPQNFGIFFGPVVGLPEEPSVELTREREAGFDIEAVRNRVGVSFTWYTKRTSDVGAVSPFMAPRFQRMEALNRGVEASLRAGVIATPRVEWDVRLWYAYNHNELTSLDGPTFPIAGDALSPQVLFPGAPVAAHRYSAITSIQDLDGDGLLDSACRGNVGDCEVVLGAIDLRPAFPARTASLETTLRLGMVTIGALFEHRGGQYRANITEAVRCTSACLAAYDERAPELERARAAAAQSGFQDVFVEDASFTKLREIAVRFTAPARWAEAFGASRLDVSLAGRNVTTWTDYSGLDPEAMSGTSLLPLLSRDIAAAPIPRRLSLRITATK